MLRVSLCQRQIIRHKNRSKFTKNFNSTSETRINPLIMKGRKKETNKKTLGIKHFEYDK